MDEPWAVVVAGVSGSGKTTVARAVAEATGATYAEGDDFHTPAAVSKMRSGVGLNDSDRAPWLQAIARWLTQQHAAGENVVVSCSALRRDYRDVLVSERPWVRFCLLDVPREVLEERVSGRTGHYMPASLLPSQLALLEPLADDEPGITVDASGSPDAVVRAVLDGLGFS